MSTCLTTRSPLPLTIPFSCPHSCTATLVLTTYNATATTTIVSTVPTANVLDPAQTMALTTTTTTSTYPTTGLSAYGVLAAFATSLPGGGGPRFPGGGPRFHDAGCYPPRFGEVRAGWFFNHDPAGAAAGGGGGGICMPAFYSPGMCPRSWVGVNVGTVVGVGTAGGPGEETTTTTATCCPTGFSIPPEATNGPGYCESAITGSTEVYDVARQSWTTVDSGAVRAEGIEVRWREEDLAWMNGGGDDGLSAGAKAGIGAGVGLGSVALGMGAAAVWFATRRRRRRRAREMKKVETGDVERESDEPPAYGSMKELEGVVMDGAPAELENTPPRTPELDGTGMPAEMDAVGEREVGVHRSNAVVVRKGSVAGEEVEDKDVVPGQEVLAELE